MLRPSSQSVNSMRMQRLYARCTILNHIPPSEHPLPPSKVKVDMRSRKTWLASLLTSIASTAALCVSYFSLWLHLQTSRPWSSRIMASRIPNFPASWTTSAKIAANSWTYSSTGTPSMRQTTPCGTLQRIISSTNAVLQRSSAFSPNCKYLACDISWCSLEKNTKL